jgi:hypothetical protein
MGLFIFNVAVKETLIERVRNLFTCTSKVIKIHLKRKGKKCARRDSNLRPLDKSEKIPLDHHGFDENRSQESVYKAIFITKSNFTEL